MRRPPHRRVVCDPDPRARGLATEFVGNWLDFRRFEQHNGVDRERFPGFDNDLRAAISSGVGERFNSWVIRACSLA